MRTETKLVLVKIVHTLIWLFFVCVIGSILTAGITGRITPVTWVAILLIVLEGVVLSFNRGTCPLTPLAARYTAEQEDNFDIYLPRVLARYNKQIFTPIAVAGIVLVVYRTLR